MKFVSWNVNGIRSRIFDNISSTAYDKVYRDMKKLASTETITRHIHDESSLKHLLNENPDFICLQETRCSVEKSDNLKIPGYTSIFNESKLDGARQANRYSGTCIYYKSEYSDRISKIEYQIPGYDDQEGRIILLYLDGCSKLIMNVYVPNSGTNFQNRLKYQEALFIFLNEVIRNNIEVIYCGDYNVAYRDTDIHFNYECSSTFKKTKKDNIVGFLPEERSFIDLLKSINMIDTFEEANNYSINIKDTQPSNFNGFTWWEPRAKKELNDNGIEISIFRKKNLGWRIDYIFTANISTNKIINSHVLKHIGEENSPQSSDHAPIICEIEM